MSSVYREILAVQKRSDTQFRVSTVIHKPRGGLAADFIDFRDVWTTPNGEDIPTKKGAQVPRRFCADIIKALMSELRASDFTDADLIEIRAQLDRISSEPVEARASPQPSGVARHPADVDEDHDGQEP